MSVDFSTQLTAVATLALAALALATAVLAGFALRKQAKEVSTLLEQNRHGTEERHRYQASKVFLGVRPRKRLHVRPYARNASDFPVYDAKTWYLESGNISGPDPLGIIMPGERPFAKRPLPPAEALSSTYLTFRDTEGRYWVRAANGDFRELLSCPTEGCEERVGDVGFAM
jgi:hypothetical protein